MARGFRPGEASSRSCSRAAFTVCGVSQTRKDVVSLQVWKVMQNFIRAHARSQILKDILHSNAQAAHTRLAAALARLNGNSLTIVHNARILLKGKWSTKEKAAFREAGAISRSQNRAAASSFSNPRADLSGLTSARLNWSGRRNSRAAARTSAARTRVRRCLTAAGARILP